MNKRAELVVVTGGAGFIGSHTVEALLERGLQVVVLDDFSTGHRENLAACNHHNALEVVDINIIDGIWGALADVVRRRGPVDRIIHLAARTSVVDSMNNPLEDIRINYAGTAHIMEYARHSGVKKIVFASSAAIYGDVDALPVSESTQAMPMSPYGINKHASEKLLSYYAHIHGISTQSLRFFNVYGPRQDPNNPYTGVISIFLKRALNGQDLTVYGNGEQTRDFVYVGDIARCLVESCLNNHGKGEAYNLGTGIETSVNALAKGVLEITNGPSRILHATTRAGEIVRSYADICLAQEHLGFRPTVTIHEGLRNTTQWMRSLE